MEKEEETKKNEVESTRKVEVRRVEFTKVGQACMATNNRSNKGNQHNIVNGSHNQIRTVDNKHIIFSMCIYILLM